MSGALADHFCPGCGAPQRPFARYPWYFCQPCLETATDGEGRRLVFGNALIGGGFTWAYADAPQDRDDTATNVICLIAGRPVTVGEARFGGVVAEPVNSASAHLRTSGDRTVVLTGGAALAAAHKRLKGDRTS